MFPLTVMIRVRSKQPFSTDSKTAKTQLPSVMHPVVSLLVTCVFRTTNNGWRIGRVLQFSYYLGKKVGAKQYSGLTADVSNTKIGILCSWYTAVNDEVPQKFIISHETILHTHISMELYLCTLPNTECFGNLSDSPRSTMNTVP